MNDIFTASNGIEIDANAGRLRVIKTKGRPLHIMGPITTEALREFFRAERDEELSRWRNPEKPNEVVYPQDDGVIRVFDERDSTAIRWDRVQAEDDEYAPGFGFDTARAYYAAHPEPRPWEEAKEGEVWVLTRWGVEKPYLVAEGEFITPDLAVIVDLDCGSITAGRRVWPEGEEN